MSEQDQSASRTRKHKPQGSAFYLTMRDGVRIAVDLWLPGDLNEGDKIPCLMRATRYGRNYRQGALLRLLLALGFYPPLPPYIEIDQFTRSGYALVLVDCRGSGASFGNRPIEWSRAEIEDLGEVVAWVISQPWSNGRVGAQGVSYDGNTAELAASTGQRALRAVAPRFSDFDPHLNVAMPGGVFNAGFIRAWNEANRKLDSDNLAGAYGIPAYLAPLVKLFVTGLKPVDDDRNMKQLKQAMAARDNIDVHETLSKATFRDDALGPRGETLSEIAPYALRDAIEAGHTPMYVVASWLDAASADGALSRFLTFNNPQRVIIGAWSHGGQHNADPFAAPRTSPDPPLAEQYAAMMDFFDRHLKEPPEAITTKTIHYYTLGEGDWKATNLWPPEGFEHQRLYLAPQGQLTTEAPTKGNAGEDAYRVDYSATTGERNRWMTQLHGGEVRYPDRAGEDRKLLIYTGEALDDDTEITGSPYVTLHLSSSYADGALHVYLEDVAPDGRVTYITEGIFRLLHRKLSQETPAYVPLGPYHSYRAADASLLTPGEVVVVRFSLFATSVLIRRGHAIRLALAGHDASTFARYPALGDAEIRVLRSPEHDSHINLPMKGRNA